MTNQGPAKMVDCPCQFEAGSMGLAELSCPFCHGTGRLKPAPAPSSDSPTKSEALKKLVCPKCGAPFDDDEAECLLHSDPVEGYLEVEIRCQKGHSFFGRLTRNDLMQV